MGNSLVQSIISNPSNTYISPGTDFEGLLHTPSDIVIAGNVTGEVVSDGRMVVQATYNGNAAAKELLLQGASMKGDAVIAGMLIVDEGSTLIGNSRVGSLQCDGHIEGNATAASEAVVGGKATVKGDVTAPFMSVTPGAKLNGQLNVAGTPS